MPHTVYVDAKMKPYISLQYIIARVPPLTNLPAGTQKSSTKRRTPLAAHRFVRVAVMMEMRKLNRMPNVLENLVVPSLRPNRHLRPTKRSKTSVLEKNDHCMSRTCSAGSWGYCAPMGSCDIYPTHQITPPNLFYICGTTIKKNIVLGDGTCLEWSSAPGWCSAAGYMEYSRSPAFTWQVWFLPHFWTSNFWVFGSDMRTAKGWKKCIQSSLGVPLLLEHVCQLTGQN